MGVFEGLPDGWGPPIPIILLYVPKSESEAEFERPPLLPASLKVDENEDQKWKGMICRRGRFGLELILGNRP